MLVRDLISRLQKFNPDDEIRILSTDNSEDTSCPNVVSETYTPTSSDPYYEGFDICFDTKEECLEHFSSIKRVILIRPFLFGE